MVAETEALKLVIVVPDGMADRPDEFEDGMTPLERARTPVMDELPCRKTWRRARTRRAWRSWASSRGSAR